jgi:hypothetical protein
MIRKYKMSPKVVAVTLILISFFFLSNRSGVPQAVTKAPGETANASCNACHSGGSFSANVNLTLMRLDSSIVTTYIPGEKHIVKVKVSGTGSKNYGFQMTSLANAGTKDVGVWSNFGSSVKQLKLINRQYLCQSTSRLDGVFYAQWTAPPASDGEIKFYYSGLAGNSNGNNNGDEAAFSSSTYLPSGISSTNHEANSRLKIYPNPASDFISISDAINGKFQIVDMFGKIITQGSMQNQIDISNLTNGVYGLVLFDNDKRLMNRLTFVKQ